MQLVKMENCTSQSEAEMEIKYSPQPLDGRTKELPLNLKVEAAEVPRLPNPLSLITPCTVLLDRQDVENYFIHRAYRLQAESRSTVELQDCDQHTSQNEHGSYEDLKSIYLALTEYSKKHNSCMLCYQKFGNTQALLSHKREVHGIAKCQECSTYFIVDVASTVTCAVCLDGGWDEPELSTCELTSRKRKCNLISKSKRKSQKQDSEADLINPDDLIPKLNIPLDNGVISTGSQALLDKSLDLMRSLVTSGRCQICKHSFSNVCSHLANVHGLRGNDAILSVQNCEVSGCHKCYNCGIQLNSMFLFLQHFPYCLARWGIIQTYTSEINSEVRTNQTYQVKCINCDEIYSENEFQTHFVKCYNLNPNIINRTCRALRKCVICMRVFRTYEQFKGNLLKCNALLGSSKNCFDLQLCTINDSELKKALQTEPEVQVPKWRPSLLSTKKMKVKRKLQSIKRTRNLNKASSRGHTGLDCNPHVSSSLSVPSGPHFGPITDPNLAMSFGSFSNLMQQKSELFANSIQQSILLNSEASTSISDPVAINSEPNSAICVPFLNFGSTNTDISNSEASTSKSDPITMNSLPNVPTSRPNPISLNSEPRVFNCDDNTLLSTLIKLDYENKITKIDFLVPDRAMDSCNGQNTTARFKLLLSRRANSRKLKFTTTECSLCKQIFEDEIYKDHILVYCVISCSEQTTMMVEFNSSNVTRCDYCKVHYSIISYKLHYLGCQARYANSLFGILDCDICKDECCPHILRYDKQYFKQCKMCGIPISVTGIIDHHLSCKFGKTDPILRIDSCVKCKLSFNSELLAIHTTTCGIKDNVIPAIYKCAICKKLFIKSWLFKHFDLCLRKTIGSTVLKSLATCRFCRKIFSVDDNGTHTKNCFTEMIESGNIEHFRIFKLIFSIQDLEHFFNNKSSKTICRRLMLLFTDIEVHMQNYHLTYLHPVCMFCNRFLENLNVLKYHYFKTGRKLKCEICRERCHNVHDLNVHCLSCHIRNPRHRYNDKQLKVTVSLSIKNCITILFGCAKCRKTSKLTMGKRRYLKFYESKKLAGECLLECNFCSDNDTGHSKVNDSETPEIEVKTQAEEIGIQTHVELESTADPQHIEVSPNTPSENNETDLQSKNQSSVSSEIRDVDSEVKKYHTLQVYGRQNSLQSILRHHNCSLCKIYLYKLLELQEDCLPKKLINIIKCSKCKLVYPHFKSFHEHLLRSHIHTTTNK